MAGFCLCHAGASKPLHKAGRRGGDTSARSEWKLMFECCIKEEIILRENGNEKESYSGFAKAKSSKFN